MSAQRLEQKGRYFSSAGLPQTGHWAWILTARNGTGRSGFMTISTSRGRTAASTGWAARPEPDSPVQIIRLGSSGVDQVARVGDLVRDLVELVEAEVGQRHEHRRGQARIQALQRDLAAVREAHGVLVQATLEAAHHHLFGRANAQGLLQGLVDTFQAQMGAGRDAGSGVAAGAGGKAHGAGTKANELVGLADSGGNRTIQFEGIVTHFYKPSRRMVTARLTEWGESDGLDQRRVAAFRSSLLRVFQGLELPCQGHAAARPGQLEMTKSCESIDLAGDRVFTQRLGQSGLYFVTVIGTAHGHEIHHDRPGEVTQPELLGDRRHRLEIDLDRPPRRPTLAAAGARAVDIDGAQGLARLEQDLDAARQRDTRRERGVDLAGDIVDIERRHRTIVPAHADLLL